MLKNYHFISHGLIIAVTYRVPNAWLSSGSLKADECKFYDYFISVDKARHTPTYGVTIGRLDLRPLLQHFHFDNRPINFKPEVLLAAYPFLRSA